MGKAWMPRNPIHHKAGNKRLKKIVVNGSHPRRPRSFSKMILDPFAAKPRVSQIYSLAERSYWRSGPGFVCACNLLVYHPFLQV